MLQRLFAVVLLSLTLFPGAAFASQVSYRPLDQVVDEKTQVFIATVTAVKAQNDDRELVRSYDITGATSLRGAVPPGSTVAYTEIIPIMRGADGAVVGWFSPILDASGEEMNVKAGTKYLFLARGVMRDGALLVFRVEPMSNEAKVRALLATPPDASAGTVAVASAPPLSPSASVAVPTASASAAPPPPTRPARSGCAVGFDSYSGEAAARVTVLLGTLLAFRRRRGQPVATSDS